jgi:hypothetical protein
MALIFDSPMKSILDDWYLSVKWFIANAVQMSGSTPISVNLNGSLVALNVRALLQFATTQESRTAPLLPLLSKMRNQPGMLNEEVIVIYGALSAGATMLAW